MTFTGFPDEAFTFYEGLRADNSKTYWTAHKAVYERAVRAPLQALLDELSDEFGEPKLFRPYRDVRFSADKSPYKTQQGAFCATGDGSGYYLALDADGLFVAGGFHSHTKDQTVRYRAAVTADDSGEALARIVTDLEKDGFTIGGDTVRTRPRGCPADHPRLDLMRHEALTASRPIPVAPELETRAALDTVRDGWHALGPLVDWTTRYVMAAP